MARHSKWHNIRHKKALQDAKKAKVYTRIGKLIQIAAKEGPDPSMNPSLVTALDKARYFNVPKDIIDRAIKKGSGGAENEALEEIIYEGYGPQSVAIIVRCITSNKNRTSGNLKALFGKHGGNLGAPGSVSWQFEEKGEIIVDGKKFHSTDKGKQITTIVPFEKEKIEEDLIELLIEDIIIEDNTATIYCSKENFAAVKEGILDREYSIGQAELIFEPSNTVACDMEKLENFLDALDEDDDVDTYFHNANDNE